MVASRVNLCHCDGCNTETSIQPEVNEPLEARTSGRQVIPSLRWQCEALDSAAGLLTGCLRLSHSEHEQCGERICGKMQVRLEVSTAAPSGFTARALKNVQFCYRLSDSMVTSPRPSMSVSVPGQHGCL